MEIENQVIYSHDIWQYGEAQIGFSMIPEVIIETITNHYRTYLYQPCDREAHHS